MYNGKFVSYLDIIEQVYRDFKFQYVFQITDAIEWLGSAMRQLKIPRYFVDKVTDGNKDLYHPDYIEIVDGRGKLPCDLYSITQTARALSCREYAGDPLIISGISYYDYDTGETCHTGDGSTLCSQFGASGCNTCGCTLDDHLNSTCEDDTYCCETYLYAPMRWNTNTFYKAYHGTQLDYMSNSGYTYTVNNNYIFTNFKEGKVAMAYKAVPTDNDGFPLVPDNESVINYVKWFIAEKIAFQLFLEDKYNERKYEYFASNLQLYFRKAKNEGKLPHNLDEWESYKNDRIRSIKNVNHHESFFGNMQAPEVRYNHPRFRSIFGQTRLL